MSKQFPEDHSRNHTVIGVAIFLSSASIGAGILGLPVQTGMAGTAPALTAMVAVWAMMLFSGYFIADIYLENGSDDSDIPELLEKPLGKTGKILGSIGYLFNAYGILVAYIAASGSVLQALFTEFKIGEWFYIICFLIPAITATLAGYKIVAKANGTLMLLLFVSFAILLFFAFGHSEPSRWSYVDFSYAAACFPVILTAFVIHNLIPSVCRILNRNRHKIRVALFWGMTIPLIFNAVWTLAVAGALSIQGKLGIATTYAQGHPATVPLEQLTSSKTIMIAGMLFSITAIFTSFTAVGVGMKSFYKDLLNLKEGKKAFWILTAIVFVPPVSIAFIDPAIFIDALGLVGGIAVSLVYGIMPCLIICKTAKSAILKKSAMGLLLLFLLIMILEICRQCGLIK